MSNARHPKFGEVERIGSGALTYELSYSKAQAAGAAAGGG